MKNMRYNVYPKEKTEKRKSGDGRPFQTGCKRQIFNAFSILSSLHNLYINRLSI